MKSTLQLGMIGLILLTCCYVVQAQELARKGTLGIQMQDNTKGKGLEVLRVFDNTTASALQLIAGDILLTANGVAFNEVEELVQAVGNWKAGDALEVVIRRDGQRQVLVREVVGKPLEQSEYGELIYGAVAYGGGLLRTILELPKGVERPPVLLFMQGVGCASIDYPYHPEATVKLLIEELVKHGVAVFRVEKPGMGDSYGEVGCREMDYPYEVGAFEAALKQLKAMDGFDSSNIFLFGESLSSITAPLLANKHRVAGIVAWGGLSKSWFEYSLRLMKDQKIRIGKDVASTEERFREYVPLFYDFFILQKTKEELESTKAYKDFLGSFLKGDQWRGLHHYRFFQTLNEVDVLTAYSKVDCPVLALAGDCDVHTIDTSWTNDIAYAVNEHGNGQAEVVIFPQTTHHYFKVDSMEEYVRRYLKGEIRSREMAENFNAEIGRVVADWVKAK
ncbi:MAG: PDZ domain-containing protein [Bacteroidota bacterium]